MINFLKNLKWRKCYCLLSFSLLMFLLDYIMYPFCARLKIQQYWVVIPVLLYLIFNVACKFIRKIRIVAISLETTSLISMAMLLCSIKIKWFNIWLESQYEVVSFGIIMAFFISVILARIMEKEKKVEPQNSLSNQLFNLFYLNTSKAHEIAMLIDNKIMKTIEREQVSEELLKYSTSLSFGKKDNPSTEMGYSVQDSSKKRVYENFDVKTTKSIMLRKIYETAQNKKKEKKELQIGDLTVFDNIELQQRNIDDTVMILNVLQDSKIKNQGNDDLEINLSKMMNKMLDDFTIDYVFSYKGNDGEVNDYLIQLPYKSTDNFENGYQHNDLQLGKLSLIGIYRGKIDFSKRDSISSKFLDMMSESYNEETQKHEDMGIMKLSSNKLKPNDIQFKFHHQKLKRELHLIDVIAIIQELNFDKEE
ncbi:hypothetical protein KPL47_02535 [Clostridium estertheticum]|uniref:hypothetical protein n=1 Tax=Clostridium estertheticum TaxID=238834 RepID=UPI001C0BBD18|nr:hypothetical protein [Clostridium estertheticum]MBU3175239.1 hypothetical protein [Clostridium estertheticum]